MISEISHQNDAKIARVTLSLPADVYDRVRELSQRMGLRPSSWIAMIISTQINDVRLDIREGGKK